MEHKAKWPVPLHQSSSIQPTIMMTRAARNRRFINGPLWSYLRVSLQQHCRRQAVMRSC
jgi:hypothetical protein